MLFAQGHHAKLAVEMFDRPLACYLTQLTTDHRRVFDT
jgi:hypothetical protein